MKRIISLPLVFVILLCTACFVTSCEQEVPVFKAETYSPSNNSVISAVAKLNLATERSKKTYAIQEVTVEVSGQINWQDFLYIKEHILQLQNASKWNRVKLDMSKAYGIDALKECAFYGVTCIEIIKLPKGLKRIGKYSFFGCDALTEVVIPYSIQQLGYSILVGNAKEVKFTFEGSPVFEIDFKSFVGAKYKFKGNAKPWTLEYNHELFSLVHDGDTHVSTLLAVQGFAATFSLTMTQHCDKDNSMIWDDLTVDGQTFRAVAFCESEQTDFTGYDLFLPRAFTEANRVVTVSTDCTWYSSKNIGICLRRDIENADEVTVDESGQFSKSLGRCYFSVPKAEV